MTEDRGAGGTAPAGLSEFIKRFRVGWGDPGANVHLSNVAILNHAADVGFPFFTECGFGGARFAQEHLGPVVTRDTLSYRKELRMMEEYTVELRSGGVSPDGVRWAVENTFRNLAAR